MPRSFHVDDAGRLRSGWLSNADPDREPDEADTPAPPSADAGAGRDDRPQQPPDMNALIRDAAALSRTWFSWSG